MKKSLQIICVYLVFHFSMSQDSHCQGLNYEPVLPTKHGHSFVRNSLIDFPFVNTTFGMSIGIGTTVNLGLPVVEINDEVIVSFKGNLLFANMAAFYRQKVTDWAAVFLRLTFAARIGTDVGSIVVHGFNTVSGFQTGWVLRLSEGERHMLSSIVSVNSFNGNFINIEGFIEDLIDSVPNPTISKRVPVLTGEVGLTYVYALSSLFGLTLTGSIAFGESFERGGADVRYGVGVMLDLNMYRRLRVPLGASMSFNMNSFPQFVYTQSKSGLFYGLKLAYTGTQDLVLGIESQTFQVPIEGLKEKTYVQNITFNMTYYFN